MIKLLKGNNLDLLKELPDNSVDSIVTDPPYGLSFMNKKWDYDVPNVEFWKEVLRVLKPGGHVLSFGGTRTYHRMVVNLEDGGFEIRDTITYHYGQGFPKSHNIGKSVDKIKGNEREVIGWQKYHRNHNDSCMDEYKRPFDLERQNGFAQTKGQSDWEGWGTALKPAVELICLARKPLSEKSVAENVLKWGTGGINIDGCRIGSEVRNNGSSLRDIRGNGLDAQISSKRERLEREDSIVEGRFPANVILECICDEVIKGDKGDIHSNPLCPCYILDKQSGFSKSSIRKPTGKSKNEYTSAIAGGAFGNDETIRGHNDSGGASRFFYNAKASKAERNMGLDDFEDKETNQKGHGLDRICMNCGVSMLKPIDCKCEEPDWRPKPKKNHHPTLKPVNLMVYLCRLMTPKGGVILDPFMGSGSTGIGALLEGFSFIGMEQDEEYFNIAEARINQYEKYRKFLK